MESRDSVQQRFQAALDAIVSRLEQDLYVLAAVVYGSVARGEAWERSDMDMEIIIRDGLERVAPYRWLDQDGINVSASVIPRSQFKRAMDGALQGSVLHAIRSHARLLFSKDESITAWFGETNRIGARDQAFQLLRTAASVTPTLDKAEKWLYVKNDPHYSFVWIMYVVNELARVEVVLNGEAPGREVIHQALQYNPTFFHAVYTDLIDGPKDRTTMERALIMINRYMAERADRMFGPVLDYLAEANGMRTVSELDAHFRKKIQRGDLFWVYEWLSRQGIVARVSAPVRLTRKSQVTLQEPAYYYDGDLPDEW
jgi:polymorphic toxin system nucleotidyltransferase-like protein